MIAEQTKKIVEEYLQEEVAPEVVADVVRAIQAFKQGAGPSTVTVTVGPFAQQVTIDLRLLLGGSTRAAAAKAAVAGKGKVTLAKGRTGKLKVKLSSKTRKLLRKRGRLKATALLTITNDVTGARTTARKPVTLRAKKKRK